MNEDGYMRVSPRDFSQAIHEAQSSTFNEIVEAVREIESHADLDFDSISEILMLKFKDRF